MLKDSKFYEEEIARLEDRLALFRARGGEDLVCERLEKQIQDVKYKQSFALKREAEQAAQPQAERKPDGQLMKLYDKMTQVMCKIGDISQDSKLQDKLGYERYIKEYQSLIKEIQFRERVCDKVGIPYERPFKEIEIAEDGES